MARKIGVLDCHQPAHAQPSRFLKKTVASTLLRRNLAERLDYNLIRMRALRQETIILSAAQLQACRPNYIPVKMPPREVNGTWFQMPQSDQWKIQHRTVKFMPRMAGPGIEATA